MAHRKRHRPVLNERRVGDLILGLEPNLIRLFEE
jgi:hypothetical protein